MNRAERPAIAVEGLRKTFGSVEALKGIDFTVPAGTIFGLLGPNGAGKTTAVRILATILKPDAGHAEVLGYDVARNAGAVRHLIGLAGQSAAVDPNLTGRENLRLIGTLAQLPKPETRSRASELLERFDLVAAGDRPIRTYSGGMRRRLDVAAALVSKPPVIFLDEPTTGLDIQSRTELWSVIRELVAEGSTVLLTTQYLEEADQLADRIAVVNAGLVVANDTAAALKSKLGNTVIEVTMASEAQAQQAQAVLARAVPGTEREGSRVRVSTPDAPHVLTQMLRSLDVAGLSAVNLTVREPSLDDVFLSLTGKHVGEELNGGTAKAGKATDLAPDHPPLLQAASVIDQIIEGLEFGEAEPETGGNRWPMVFGGNQGANPGLDRVLAALPYKAGVGAVVDNLEEVAKAAIGHYEAGGGDHIDLSPLAGYLTLEQRFGRISRAATPDQAAALLMGAAYASASGMLKAGRRSPGGDVGDFARGSVRILMEGISESDARIRR